jgi:hypothetical protein
MQEPPEFGSQTLHFLSASEQPNLGSHFGFAVSSTQLEAPSGLHAVIPGKQAGVGFLPLQSTPAVQLRTHVSPLQVSFGLQRDLQLPPPHSSHGPLQALLQHTASLHTEDKH